MDMGEGELRRLSGEQRRRAMSHRGRGDATDLAARKARWAADTEAAFLAAGAQPQRRPARPATTAAQDLRARRDRWLHDLDEVFTDAS